MGFAQTATQYREVLRKYINKPAINRAPACDNAITQGDTAIASANKGIGFSKSAFIEQKLEPFAGG